MEEGILAINGIDEEIVGIDGKGAGIEDIYENPKENMILVIEIVAFVKYLLGRKIV